MSDEDRAFTVEEIKHRVAGSLDRDAGHESKYESLLASRSPYAEHYRAGYDRAEDAPAERPPGQAEPPAAP